MRCEILDSCGFFGDNMRELPKAAEYLKERLCHGDYQSCSRYRIFKEKGAGQIPPDLVPHLVEPD